MTIEGHENCIPTEHFKMLQELHDAQKKIIFKLQQDKQTLELKVKELEEKLALKDL